MMKNLFGKTLEELQQIMAVNNLPNYSAVQIADWIYRRNIRSFNEMTNISKKNREFLKENFIILTTRPVNVSESSDGTKKYLFPVSADQFIEVAYIPDKNRKTLCMSSQIGCMRSCRFCMTARQGFHGNLTAGEIVNQLLSLPEKESITNLVYMGMGEPLDNLHEVMKSLEILTNDYGPGLSPKRITVSTIGIIPEMRQFIENSECHLAVSLHSPFHEERKKIMPVEKIYPIKDIIDILKQYDWKRQRRLSFEYIMFRGINDTPAHAKGLVKLLNGLKCRINLIRYHRIPGVQFEPSPDDTIKLFKDDLNNKGLFTTIRASRGTDINAACGLLSTKNKQISHTK